ncbi:hypothetical protein [Aeromonas sp. LsrichE-8G]|uniref:hypothetical protein n=1 Tax=Aeromonas sp. LsrichE-8G TaxID=2932048 RepID=UPI001FD36AE4|nr:hypothetical protein [Aeromonas sp. LsrichE-8G]
MHREDRLSHPGRTDAVNPVLVNRYDKTPANAQEGVFWHLLHSLHLWDEQRLLCDDALRLQLMACANFLADEGPCPHHCIGSRP